MSPISGSVVGYRFDPGLDPATSAWVAAVVVNGGSTSSQRQLIVDTLIRGLKADGVWTKLDRLFVLAAENQGSALTDMVASNLATAVNSPTFTTDRGYTGASTKYINTGYAENGTGNVLTSSSAHLSGWVMNNNTGLSGANFVGENTSDVSVLGWFNPNMVATVISTTGATAIASGTNQGLWTVTRNGSAANSCSLYQNGSLFSSAFGGSASSASSSNFYILAENQGPSPGGAFADVISAMSVGALLSATDAANLYSRLRTYMTAVGVP